MSITVSDVLTGFEKLATVFTPPATARGELELLARAWVEALNDVSAEDFATCVALWIRHEPEYWPKPAQLRSLVPARSRTGGRSAVLAPATLAAMASGAPCPHCGCVLKPQAERGGRLGWRHAADCPAA